MNRPDANRARAEGQRLRIIRLLEQLTDADEKDQCPSCGNWYKRLSAHSCDGPE